MKLCCRPLAKMVTCSMKIFAGDYFVAPTLFIIRILGQNRIPYTKSIRRSLRHIIFLLLSQVWSRVYIAARAPTPNSGWLSSVPVLLDQQSHTELGLVVWHSPPNFPIIFAWNDRSGSRCLILRLLQCPLPIQQQQHTPTVNSHRNIWNETLEPLMACMPCETALNVQTSHFK